jgi:hypothetical protein
MSSEASAAAHSDGGANGGHASEAKTEGVLADARQRIKAYYEQKLDLELSRLRQMRLSTRWRKIALAALGAGLLLACGAAWLASLYGYITLPRLELYEIGLATVATILLAIALLTKSIEDVPEAEEIEREVDIAREQDIHTLLEGAKKVLATVQQPAPQFELKLVGYPDRELCERLGAIKCARLALDQQRLRLTPAKVTALELLPERFAVYEGTLDLTTGLMLAERLVEAYYRDIQAIERSSIAQPEGGDPPRGIAKIAKMRPARPRPLRDQDTLTIQIANNQAVRVVLRDSHFAATLKGARLPLSDSHEAIERFWHEIRKRWLEARASK